MIERKLKTALVYGRVSTDKSAQEGSIEDQRVDGRKAAEELGCENIIVLTDEKSGTTAEARIGYQEMLGLIKEQKIDVIVTKCLDRLNRNTDDWSDLRRLARMQGVKIYFYLTRRFYSKEDKLSFDMEAHLAEAYSDNQSLKVNAAHRKRQSSGRSAIFTNAVWGYKTVYNPDGTSRLIIDEEEAGMIELIFSFADDGLGMHRISKELYKIGYRNHNGNKLGCSVIREILRNPKVTGTIIVNKKHFDFETKKTFRLSEDEWIKHDDCVPKIIDRELFDVVNEKLDARSALHVNGRLGGTYKGKYKLSGKIFCGDCGEKYIRNSRKVMSGRIYEWNCKTYKEYGRNKPNKYKAYMSGDCLENGCNNIRIKETDILEVLGKVIVDYFQSDANNVIGEALRLLMKVFSQTESSLSIEGIIKKIEAVKQKKERLIDLHIDNLISKEDFIKRDKALGAELSNLQDNLEQIRDKEEYRNSVEDRLKKIEDTLNSQFSEITVNTLLEYIDRILIYADRADIEVNLGRLIGISNSELENKIVILSQSLELYKTGYSEAAMDRTKEAVYEAIKEDTKAHICDIMRLTGLTRGMVDKRVRTLKDEGFIASKGARETFEWIVL